MKKTNILIVEDDEWTAEQHVRVLEAAGYQASYARHTLEAIEAIDTHPPAVIILDILLTGQNAFTLMHELQSHADLAAIPIILCTNSADAVSSEDVASYGVRMVLDKAAMQPEDLTAGVRKVLS